MESNTGESAQEQLAALAASRERAIGRILLPWRYVIGYAVVANQCLLSLVLPIVLSYGWTLLVQTAFLAASIALLVTQRRRQAVKRPMFRIQGAWVVNVIMHVGLGSALVVGILARAKGSPWLGATALLLNFAGFLVVYGGHGFLLRRQLNGSA